jgi:divalent metal cation (Fe/Co/Zn/Cd) transporter
LDTTNTDHLTIQNPVDLRKIFIISVVTVVYNILEGLFAIYFGLKDETLTLFGFGIDSFIETISATGILYMVYHMKTGHDESNRRFEKLALRITGWCFYLLSAGLVAGVVINLAGHRHPESTLAGLVISSVSIVFMIYLVWIKRRLGHRLHSPAIIADAGCSLVCIYMSMVLLFSSGIFALFHLGFIDALGSLGLAFFSFREGREALENARTGQCNCGQHEV